MRLKNMILDFDDNIDDDGRINNIISKNEQLITLPQDPLALSWASYHVWLKNPGHRWASLEDVTAGDHDIEMANICRRYYCDQLLVDTLKRGAELSQYRRTLYALLTGNKSLTNGDLGIIYRLPYFYVEDTHRDSLREMFAGRTVNSTTGPKESVRRLTGVTSILKSRRAHEIQEFWFRDEKDNVPVTWTVSTQNPLKSLLTGVYNSSFEKPIAVKSIWFPKNLRGFEYLQVGAGELV